MIVPIRSAFDPLKITYNINVAKVPKRQSLVQISDQLFLVLGVVDGVVILAGLPCEIAPIKATV